MRIRSVCAWCGKSKDGLGPIIAGDKISHGICKQCEKIALDELEGNNDDRENEEDANGVDDSARRG